MQYVGQNRRIHYYPMLDFTYVHQTAQPFFLPARPLLLGCYPGPCPIRREYPELLLVGLFVCSFLWTLLIMKLTYHRYLVSESPTSEHETTAVSSDDSRRTYRQRPANEWLVRVGRTDFRLICPSHAAHEPFLPCRGGYRWTNHIVLHCFGAFLLCLGRSDLCFL